VWWVLVVWVLVGLMVAALLLMAWPED